MAAPWVFHPSHISGRGQQYPCAPSAKAAAPSLAGAGSPCSTRSADNERASAPTFPRLGSGWAIGHHGGQNRTCVDPIAPPEDAAERTKQAALRRRRARRVLTWC